MEKKGKAKFSILLLDDENSVAELMDHIFRIRDAEHRYDVTTVSDGDAAMKLIESPDTKIDLFITDLSHPGIAGGELIFLVRQKYPEIRIIVQTGYGDDEILDLYAPIVDIILLKPYKSAELMTAINRLLVDHK